MKLKWLSYRLFLDETFLLITKASTEVTAPQMLLQTQPSVPLPPAVQADEAVSQAGHKVLVVVPGAKHQVAVDGQDPESVEQRHLLSHRLVGSAELVEHGAVQTVVDGVQRETLRTSFRLEYEDRKQVRGRK